MSYHVRFVAPLFLLLLLAACAAVPGPPIPFGLGPGPDQFVPILLLLVIALLVWKYSPVVRRRFGAGNQNPGVSEAAESTVRQRYAQGDITREQYLQMLDDLRRKS
jgi:uncharacterized membrane protein